MHTQYYLPLQCKHDLMHATDLVNKFGLGQTQAQKWKYSILEKDLSPGLLSHIQIPKAPASLDDTNSSFKNKAKIKSHNALQHTVAGKSLQTFKNACEIETYARVHIVKIQANCITIPICTSHPVPLHLKQRKKAGFKMFYWILVTFKKITPN